MADTTKDDELRKLIISELEFGEYDSMGAHYQANIDNLIKGITQYGDRRECEGRIDFAMLEALCLMYEQYCGGKKAHDFMGAGEAAIDILEKYNLTGSYFHIANDWRARLTALKDKEIKQ